jgi:serine/threonine protein kinase
MMHIVTTAERKCRHIPPFSLLFGTLLLATICCGVVNMATLLVLPLDHGVGGTGTNSADLARSNPLFWALLTSYTGGGVHHHGRASPRVVHLDGSEIKSRLPVAIVDNPVADTATTNNNIRQPAMVPVDPCVPMADWQTQSFVTCNMIHEIDMAVAASETTTATKDTATTLTKDTTAATASSASLTPLGEGWFRTTWRMDNADQDETVVLKTLRIIRDFSPEFYELHRRDAVAMERLTFSKYVMNVHAYCGQSAVNEMADFPVPGIQSLEALDRRMRGRDSTQADVMKLRLAASIATGVADIHAVESMDGRPAMVHYDINPRNVAITGGGRPKLNDFNIAEFLRWNPETNETCGFTSRMHEPWWRAPEEMNTTTVAKEDAVLLLDEKVDIYALGNVLYHILTTHAPRGKMKRERMEIVRPVVAQGIAPELPEPYASGTNPVYVAIRSAMALCFAKDPSERGSAEEVADLLTSAVVAVVAAHEEEDEEKGASDEPASKKDENADDDQEGGEEETE